MAEFHFVEDYQNYVRGLMAAHPIDEAMSLAVGGSYDRIGDIEAEIVSHYGLRSGQAAVDLGCGSGRLAHALGKRMESTTPASMSSRSCSTTRNRSAPRTTNSC